MHEVEIGIALFSIAAGLLLGLPLANRFQERNPEAKPYFWGFFHGVAGTVAGLCYATYALYLGADKYGRAAELLSAAAMLSLLAAALSSLIVARNKFGWITVTVLSLNPILWVINSIYVKRRWHELRWMPNIERNWLTAIEHRAAIGISALWVGFVSLYVFFFEPYGTMYEDDWYHFAKVLVFVPLFVFAALFTYKKIYRAN